MATDIEKCFLFLHENVPSWLKHVSDIDDKIIAMQSELAKIPVSRSLPLKRRTGSTESIRDLAAIREDDPPSPGGAHQSEPTSHRRRSPSVISGQHSGFAKMRSRTMIVVHYDGKIQDAFEQLVRNIGTGRGMLRKGKMAAKMDAMAAAANSSDDEDDGAAILAKIGYRQRTGLSTMKTTGLLSMTGSKTSTPIERFEAADKALEQAQALCERAAHQSLREGNCKKELDGVREYFDEVHSVAKSEVARYAVQMLVAKEKIQQEAANQGSNPARPSNLPMPALEKELTPSIEPQPTNPFSTSKTIDIEIDDNEESDEADFVMPPVRLTSRR